MRVGLSDRTYKPALSYDLDVTGSLRKLTSDRKAPAEFDAKVRIAQGGSVQVSGTVAQDFKQASAKANVSGLSAAPLRPVLSRHTTLDLKSGSASITARVEYRAKAKPETRVQASAKIADLLVNEAASGDRFVSWKSLDAADIALTLSPNRLTIKDVRVEEPGAKIAIAKDRSVNLTRVLKRGDSEAAAPAVEAETERFPCAWHGSRCGKAPWIFPTTVSCCPSQPACRRSTVQSWVCLRRHAAARSSSSKARSLQTARQARKAH